MRADLAGLQLKVDRLLNEDLAVSKSGDERVLVLQLPPAEELFRVRVEECRVTSHQVAREDVGVGSTSEGCVEQEGIVLRAKMRKLHESSLKIVKVHLQIISQEQTAVSSNEIYVVSGPAAHMLPADHQARLVPVLEILHNRCDLK